MPIHHYGGKGGKGKPQVPTTFAIYGHQATKKNESGDVLKPGEWVTRNILTEIYNDIKGVSVEAPGKLTLPPGAYTITGSASACGTGNTRIRIGRPHGKGMASFIHEGDSVIVDQKHLLNYWLHVKYFLVVPKGKEEVIAIQTMTEFSNGDTDGGNSKGVEKYKFVTLEVHRHFRD